MDRFWDLMEKNTIVSSIIAAGLITTACYMWATGQVVPDTLAGSLALVLGYFLGAKVEHKSRQVSERRIKS